MRAALLSLALGLAACASGAPETAPKPAPTRDLAAAFDCARTAGLALVSAHRGGYREGFPENAIETMEAARLAAGATPLLYEMDIRRTADGVLVLMHDDTWDRTTTGTGLVAEANLAQAAAFRLQDENDAATAFSVPTLDAALAWGKDKGVLKLDVKRGVPFEPIVAAVQRADARDRIVVITYNAADAATVHRLDPRLMISADIPDEAKLQAHLTAGIAPDRLLAFTGTREPNPAFWSRLRGLGIEPIFGTLGPKGRSWDDRIAADGSDAEYAEFAAQGLTIIATNRPLAAARALYPNPESTAVLDRCGW